MVSAERLRLDEGLRTRGRGAIKSAAAGQQIGAAR